MIAYSQRDARWRGVKLGTGAETIGQAGCLLCCAAAVLSAYPAPGTPGGWPLRPDELNRELVARGGFTSGNLFVFGALRAWGVNPIRIADCQTTPAPMDLIARARGAGDQVVVLVDFGPGGKVDQHWVCVVDPEASVIMDPWQPSGREFVPLARYLAPGWDAARGIFRVVVYRPVLDHEEHHEEDHEGAKATRSAEARRVVGARRAVPSDGAHQDEVALWRRPGAG